VTKGVSICVVVVYIGAWLVLSIDQPWVLGTNNTLLNSFVDGQFLGFMGVVVTITLASAANIHIELNKIETSVGTRIFIKTRQKVKLSAFSLIWALTASIVILVCKPFMSASAVGASLANGAALLVVLICILILVDLTKLAFNIEPVDLPD